MNSRNFLFCCLLGLTAVVLVCSAPEEDRERAEEVDVDDEKLDYAKGSLCGYCDYCKVIYIFSYYHPE